MPSGITLDHDWYECERGNTLLIDRSGENMVAWIDMGNDRRMQVAFTPANYPALEMKLLPAKKSTDAHLAAHINTKLKGWFVRKCNIDGVHYDDRTFEIAGTPDAEEDDSDGSHKGDEPDGLE